MNAHVQVFASSSQFITQLKKTRYLTPLAQLLTSQVVFSHKLQFEKNFCLFYPRISTENSLSKMSFNFERANGHKQDNSKWTKTFGALIEAQWILTW